MLQPPEIEQPSALFELASAEVNRMAAQRRSTGWGILAHPADIHCVVFHLLVVAAYVAAFTIYLNPQAAHIDSPYAMAAFVVACVVLLGWISGVDVGVNYHNHVHLKVFRSKALNLWFGRLWPITGGWPAFAWKYAHVKVHHPDTLGATDWTLPKRDAAGKFEPYWTYCFLHWPWRYFPHLWQDYRAGKMGYRMTREVPREMLIFGVVYAIPFVIDPVMGVLLWLAPHFFANILIVGSGMYVQHVDCIAPSETHPFRHSNTFFSPFFNLTMFNIGYHNVHHSFAHVHWSDLPEFQRTLQAAFDADEADSVRIGYFRTSVELAHGRTWEEIGRRFPHIEPADENARTPPETVSSAPASV